MRPITLNDGTYIYSEFTLREYLESLGFDFEELSDMIFEDKSEEMYDHVSKEVWHDAERKIDGYFCAARDLALAVDELCDEFLRKYKAKAVINVLNAIKTCVDQNRID